MPILRKCCCCFSLKTGGVILGWIGAVSSFLVLVITLIAMCNVDTIVKALVEQTQEKQLDPEMIKTYVQIFLGLYIAVSLIGLISASLLIAGAVRRNRYLILPWLITTGINVVLGCIVAICQVVGAMTHDIGAGFAVLLLMGAIIAFEIYLWLAILSLFQHLREEERNSVSPAALIYKAPPPNDGLPSYTGFA
ncbi:uncharacterized protein LOC132260405 [Phlebotomus argentipes]|uniref:uncharacterized protein LOC132260405 n=1 Tax=Phlebotomus argentipes TaxID=94469 RepID=UPI002892C3A3|nr:uncharacterized protein LOC132260405 [Phlebotomus argentipes]